MAEPITGTLPPLMLARVRALHQQVTDLERQRNDLIAAHLETLGHNPNALTVTALDMGTGAFAAIPTADLAASPNGVGA